MEKGLKQHLEALRGSKPVSRAIVTAAAVMTAVKMGDGKVEEVNIPDKIVDNIEHTIPADTPRSPILPDEGGKPVDVPADTIAPFVVQEVTVPKQEAKTSATQKMAKGLSSDDLWLNDKDGYVEAAEDYVDKYENKKDEDKEELLGDAAGFQMQGAAYKLGEIVPDLASFAGKLEKAVEVNSNSPEFEGALKDLNKMAKKFAKNSNEFVEEFSAESNALNNLDSEKKMDKFLKKSYKKAKKVVSENSGQEEQNTNLSYAAMRRAGARQL